MLCGRPAVSVSLAFAPSSLARAHLVLGQEGEVEQNLDGLGVCRHHHHLADAAVQGLGGLVRALLELLVVAGLVAT